MGVIFKNNVMYGAGDIEISPICYSEEEREVGCWTDGKPLYQKTIIIDPVPSNNWDYYDIADNIDKVVNYRGNVFQSVGTTESIEFNRYDSSNTTWYTCIVVQNDNQKFFMRSYVAKSGMAYITFQYTKTTDTPGSGLWTPQEVPAVHYSTDEHVIGTWIDGSTLYEKTYYLDNASHTTYTLEQSFQCELKEQNGAWTDSSGYRRAIPWMYTNSDIFVYYYNNQLLMQFSPSNATNINVTIRYTKSTS